VDESFIGGNPLNMHREHRLKLQRGSKASRKIAAMGMLDRETRRVQAKVIPTVKRDFLQAEILNAIEK
jgi:hypothetical protein